MKIFKGIMATAALVMAGFTAAVQAQGNPEKNPPPDIWQAAAEGDIEAIKGFIAKGKKIDDQGKYGYSILHLAAKNGHAAIAEFALANGSDINLQSNSKKTPLHYTAQHNQLALAKLLVEAKGDLTAKDKKGRTALDLATGEAKRELAAYFRSIGMTSKSDEAAAKSIHVAAKVGLIAALKKHLEAGVGVNDKNDDGYTPLHLATKKGHLDVAGILLEAEADIAVASKSGKTALHYVSYYSGNADLAKLLINAGSPINILDGRNKTPLDYAIAKKRAEVVELIRSEDGKTANELAAVGNIFAAAEVGDLVAIKKHIENGVDLNATNKQGYTALQMAVRRGQKDATALLLKNGANVNAQRKGKTSLDFAGKQEEIQALLREKGGKTGGEIKAAGSIFLASELGLVDAVNAQLAAGVDVNGKNKSGYTALHLASKKGRAQVVEILLEAKADIAIPSKSGKTALHYIVYYNGNPDLAKLLLDAEAPVNLRDGRNKTSLDYAVSKKRSELVELLRSKGAKTGSELAAAENIFAAAEVGDLEAIQKHLEDGVGLNATNKQGYTALHIAVRRGQKDAVALLVDKGANVNAQHKGKTSLDFAGKQEEIKTLLREKGGKTGRELKAAGSIFSAAKSGLMDAVKTHLTAGADVNAKNDNGYTAMHLAAKNGHVEVVGLLLQAKADITIASKSGKTALHYVTYYNENFELVERLLNAGAPVNVLDKKRKTPLDYAKLRKNDALMKLLLADGARTGKELRAENDIHYAATNGYADAVRRFIENGGDVNSVDRGGYTALQYATYNGYIEVVRVLVEAKADINAAANKRKKTALHYAAQKGRKEIAFLLLDKGAEVNKLENSERTALDIALRYRRTETGELLRQRGGKLGVELANPDDGNAEPQPLILDDELDGMDSDGVVLTMVLGQEGPGLSILGWPGEIYLIESSSDLDDWIGVGEVTNDVGRVNWSDPRGDPGKVNFYRIRLVD